MSWSRLAAPLRCILDGGTGRRWETGLAAWSSPVCGEDGRRDGLWSVRYLVLVQGRGRGAGSEAEARLMRWIKNKRLKEE